MPRDDNLFFYYNDVAIMDSCGDILLKRAIQDLYTRIQIACALVIIKQTPSGKTPESIATEIQSKLKLQWLRKTPENKECFKPSVEHEILMQHQQVLKSRLLSVLPTDELCQFQHKFKDNIDTDSFLEGSQQNDCSVEEHFHFSGSYKDEVQAKIRVNAEFIQSVLQLKTLTELHANIPVSKYIDIISGNSVRLPLLRTKPHFQSENSSYSLIRNDLRDSGISSHDEYLNCDEILKNTSSRGVSSVASSVLQYVISSCNAEQLIIKSMEAILYYFKQFTTECHSDSKVCLLKFFSTQWKGSMNEYAVSTLQKLLHSLNDDSLFGHMYTIYIEDAVCDILMTRENLDYLSMKENQCAILLQLCWSKNICARTWDLLFDQLLHLIIILNSYRPNTDEMGFSNAENESEALSMSYTIDKSYFLLFLVKNLIKSSNKYRSKSHTASENFTSNLNSKYRQEEQTSSVAELWRKHYTFATDTSFKYHDEGRTVNAVYEEKEDVSWMQKLDQMMKDVIDYPIVSTYIWDCIMEFPSASDVK